ncbi:MAG: NADH-quinone oxidoreductase subunit H [Clostridia bacterium]|nr:NADH-quinone oxidoreductase subunit H [Clostridia bacterium]
MLVYRIISAVIYLILGGIVAGLLAGIDRKLSARLQGRRGPSVLQPFYDVAKLFSKETLALNHGQFVIAFSFLLLIVFTGVLFFAGVDILLVFLALSTAAMFLVFAATSSNSAMSTMGAQREMMQMLAYEPMVLITAVGFYMSTQIMNGGEGSFKIIDIATGDLPSIVYLPGIFLGFLFILTIKFRKSPFDISTSHHAHQELVKGVTTDLSGRNLGMIEIAHWYENTFLLGVVALFFLSNDWWSIPLAVGAAALVYFIETIIDNVSARVKWELMVKLAWGVTIVCGGLNLLVLEYIF